MAGTKSLIGAALLGAALTGGTIIPLTGEQYEKDAVRVQMSDTTIVAKSVFIDKKTGVLVDMAKLPEEVKAEDVEEVQIAEQKKPPQMVKFNQFDGKPIVLIPGEQLKISVERKGKILYEADYTPDAANYPQSYGDVWTGVFKFDVQPDKVMDTAQANAVARVMGYEIPEGK
jgi:hypothetical protein